MSKLKGEIRTHIKFFKTCHKNKKQNKKDYHLPSKEVYINPWDRLLVDVIGPYRIRREVWDDPLILKALTMIDPAYGCLKVANYNDE